MIVPDTRLLQLAHTPLEDYEDLARAVCELAAAILERQSPQSSSQSYGSIPRSGAPPAGDAAAKRLPGKPLGNKLPHPCPDCGADVVTFLSKSTKRPYLCNIEMGEFARQRQVLTAANWFHNCKKQGGR